MPRIIDTIYKVKASLEIIINNDPDLTSKIKEHYFEKKTVALCSESSSTESDEQLLTNQPFSVFLEHDFVQDEIVNESLTNRLQENDTRERLS